MPLQGGLFPLSVLGYPAPVRDPVGGRLRIAAGIERDVDGASALLPTRSARPRTRTTRLSR